MILLSDPVIAAVPVGENGEPLVFPGGLRFGPRSPAMSPLLRDGLLRRLLAAQASLPRGLRLLVVEGYRSPALQQQYFTGYRDELRELHPEWTDERRHVEASKYVSPPEVAPHCTGGAVDLTLVTETGEELDMGTEVNADPERSASACFTASDKISAEARRNRDLLGEALTAAGLVNYPTEWWHWSYGERYWAHTTGATRTCYGPLPEPDSGP
ncbi:D-alanyl-D-alanine dipeptidase [Amycolatopsis bartoniae]|uniref:D-alanyl-D-alanine dipeptidase n=1 Tax=Amycolatopsis bartoniae TaxID=941986 RepID=A0A8H9IW87_9PSEU|nr:M15 family metallopeptidase [Amycolatopsis bartoniae]MBB2936432.1 D-alanyl-D-alanine dipeptidase [Amycolatopsis bartoniae]GHF68989.1 D-alanyl-D-alanine dipeptidase [Amycolatopsis bartoniae]